jgi:hypothetical protein
MTPSGRSRLHVEMPKEPSALAAKFFKPLPPHLRESGA